MPTEAEIQQLHANLQSYAQTITTAQQSIVDYNNVITEKQTARELRKAQLFAPILANRILYTNDAQRNNALIEAYSLDTQYQQHLIVENGAITGRDIDRATEENARKMYRSDELLLLYYANNPTP